MKDIFQVSDYNMSKQLHQSIENNWLDIWSTTCQNISNLRNQRLFVGDIHTPHDKARQIIEKVH